MTKDSNVITGVDKEKLNLILNQAPLMLEQGQFTQLQNLINSLPDELHSPWVFYWSASATLPIDPHSARQHYEAALKDFEKAKDLTGIYMSWAGIVDSFIFSWDDFKPLDDWIQWMQVFMQENPGFPSPEVEARIVFAMFCSLMYRQPQHPDLPVWSHRLGGMLEHIPDKNRRIAIATHYALYLGWMGEFEELTAVVERLKPSATIENVQAVHLIAWYQTEAMHYWLSADFEQSKKSVMAGLALADSSGIHLWDFILRVQDAYLAFESSTSEQWQSYLQNILSIMDKNGRLHQAHYYYVAALEALLQNRLDRAEVHISKSLKAATELGTPYPEALNCIASARILIALARFEEAMVFLQRSELLAQQINSHFLSFNLELTRAEFFFAQQQQQEGVQALSKALASAHLKKYFNIDWWRADVMCELCIQALENNIEVAFVQQLIKKRKIFPQRPPFNIDNWPWKVRIYTLGRFSVLLLGKSLSINGNAKNKPIELLKALVAMGGA